MSHAINNQLSAIHAMLAAGHRSLRIERHSLLLWGLAGGSLFAVSEHILTPRDIPDLQYRALAWLALLAAVLGGTGLLDWYWTRQVKAARDEAWSFIHRQVQKVQWVLLGLATLLTFAMFFFGGGYMVCAVWMVAIGLSLYVHGLFSEELLEWSGVIIILLGIGSLGARLPYDTLRWIAAATFGIGLPLLALLLDRGRHRPPLFRLGQAAGWTLAVLALPLWAHQRAASAVPPDLPTIGLEEFRHSGPSAGTQIVALPAGISIPVEVELGGNLFAGHQPTTTIMPLVLAEPVEVLMKDGRLTGEARLPGGAWLHERQARWISIPWIRAELTPEKGPVVRTNLTVQLGTN